MSAINYVCPNCEEWVTSPAELAGLTAKCRNCGLGVTVPTQSSAGAPAESAARPRREPEQQRAYSGSGRCDFCGAAHIQKRYLVVSGITWLFFIIPPIFAAFSTRLRQLTMPAYSFPCSCCDGCLRKFTRLQWKRVGGMLLAFAILPVGLCSGILVAGGRQEEISEVQRFLAIGILSGTLLTFCVMPFFFAFYMNRRLRDVMGKETFAQMMNALGLRRLGMKHAGLKTKAPAWAMSLRW
jgi:hypothetical protein